MLEPQPEEPEPKRGPGRPRKTQEELPAQEPKRGPGRPRKTQEKLKTPLKTEELKTPLKTPPGRRKTEEPKEGPVREVEWQVDPIAELTRLIKQRNEEQARQRKTAYTNMLGL